MPSRNLKVEFRAAMLQRGLRPGETRHGDWREVTDSPSVYDCYTTWVILGSGVFLAAQISALRCFHLAPRGLSTDSSPSKSQKGAKRSFSLIFCLASDMYFFLNFHQAKALEIIHFQIDASFDFDYQLINQFKMKLSFVALALLAARATAIPVAGDNAADSQTTHGSLEVPDILGVLTTAPAEALPLLLQEIPISLKELPKEVLDKLKSLPLGSLPPKLLGELTSLAHV